MSPTRISSISVRYGRGVSRLSILCLALLLGFIAAPVILLMSTPGKQLSLSAPQDGPQPEVTMRAEAVSLNPISRTITMNWFPDLTSLNCSSSKFVAVDIHLSNEVVDKSSPSWSPTISEDQPAFRLSSAEMCMGILHDSASFTTITKLVVQPEISRTNAAADYSAVQKYPFDVYFAPFSFYAIDAEMGEFRPLMISGALGELMEFEISLLTALMNYNDLTPNLQLQFRVERPRAVKIYVIFLCIGTGLTLLATLTLIVLNSIDRLGQTHAVLFCLPIGTLLAFTYIRSKFPGAPAGIYTNADVFVITPILITMVLCSLLLIFVIFRSILHKEGFTKQTIEERITRAYDLTRIMACVLLHLDDVHPIHTLIASRLSSHGLKIKGPRATYYGYPPIAELHPTQVVTI